MSEKQYITVPKTAKVELSGDEYIKEIESKLAEGLTLGRNQIITATLTILNGDGDKVVVSDNVEPVIKEYIERIKSLVVKPESPVIENEKKD